MSEIILESEVGVDYSHLRDLLANGNKMPMRKLTDLYLKLLIAKNKNIFQVRIG